MMFASPSESETCIAVDAGVQCCFGEQVRSPLGQGQLLASDADVNMVVVIVDIAVIETKSKVLGDIT